MKRLAWATALAMSLAVWDGLRGELAEALHDVRSASATEVWRHHFDEDVLAASFSQNGRHVVITSVAQEKQPVMGSFLASSFVWVASARQHPQLHTRWPGELVTAAAISNTGEDLVMGLMHRRQAMGITSAFSFSIEPIHPESARFLSDDELVISSYRPEAHEVEQTRIPELVFYGVQDGERSAVKVSGGGNVAASGDSIAVCSSHGVCLVNRLTGSRRELRQKHPFDRDDLRIRDVAISESGQRVAAATDVGLTVWDAATGNVAASFKLKDSHCSRIVFADERSLVAAHHDATGVGVAIVKWRFSESGLQPIGVVWQQFDSVSISPLGRTVCWVLSNDAGRPRTMKFARIHWLGKQ